jgi:signal transduction histidine kinase/ActR/RegA family two-component response regulator
VTLDFLLLPLLLSLLGVMIGSRMLHIAASVLLVPGIILLVICSRKLGPALRTMQESVKGERERLRVILDCSADAVAVLDASGLLVVANDATEKLFGDASAEEVARLWASPAGSVELTLSDGTPIPVEHWPANRLLRGEPVAESPMRFRLTSSLVWKDLQVTGRRIPRGGADAGEFVLIMRDVTPMRMVEDQLRTSQRVELVGQLASGMAHDFNNLLTVIMASAESVQYRLPPDDAMQEEFRQLLGAADHGAELANRVLALTQHRPLDQRLVPVSQLVASVGPLARRLLPATIALQVIDKTEPSDAVHVDEGSVEQLLLNLFTNARDALPDVGTVTVEMSMIQLDEQACRAHPTLRPGPHVRICVSDTGTGMDPITERQAFEPFFTTKGHAGGTGLGLAMVHRLVTSQGGGVELHSTPGVGTTVEIFFPRKVVTPVYGSRLHVPINRASAATILFAEDNDAVARATMTALESRGHRVMRAVDGVAALELFHAHAGQIDLVVSDLQMPRMSGERLVGAVRQLDPELPIVCLTASATLPEVSKRLGGRTTRFVGKPWKRDDLLAVVDVMLQLRRNPLPV